VPKLPILIVALGFDAMPRCLLLTAKPPYHKVFLIGNGHGSTSALCILSLLEVRFEPQPNNYGSVVPLKVIFKYTAPVLNGLWIGVEISVVLIRTEFLLGELMMSQVGNLIILIVGVVGILLVFTIRLQSGRYSYFWLLLMVVSLLLLIGGTMELLIRYARDR
jgi:hypothetical protein